MKQLFSFAALAAITVGSLCAQQQDTGWSRLTFDVGAGFTSAPGATGRNLNLGWNVDAGAGMKFNPWLGVNLNFGYNQMDFGSSALAAVGAQSGGLSIFSTTIDPVIHLTPHRHFDIYVTGGGGYFHRSADVAEPTIGVVGVSASASPYFGREGLTAYSVSKPGIDVGGGIAFGTKDHGKIFMEAKWDRIFVDHFGTTDYLPVTFGFRW